MIAVAVKSLECDAMRNFVCGVIGRFAATSAMSEALRPHEGVAGDNADHDAGQPAVGDLPVHPRREQPCGSLHVRVRGNRAWGVRRLGRGRRRATVVSERTQGEGERTDTQAHEAITVGHGHSLGWTESSC